jgi:hypothetical protein
MDFNFEHLIKKELSKLANGHNIKPINEDNKLSKKDGDEYTRIQNILKNDLFNHSAIIRRLGGEWEDTATKRSLFRKKLLKLTNDNGSIYHFTVEEIEKINSILITASNEIVPKRNKKNDF